MAGFEVTPRGRFCPDPRGRHSSPETKRFYQLGLAHQVREHLERVNQKTSEERDALHFRDSGPRREQVQQIEVCN